MRDPLAEPSDLIRSVSRALRVLEAVGRAPKGLTVKQIARRCELTVATTYHLVRTLAYEGYVIRREDGTYIVGLQVANRYRELVAAFRGPAEVGEALRRAAIETGYSHLLGRFVNGQVTITAVAEGTRSPCEDLVPGFVEGPHANAIGKALLATLTPEQRYRYLREYGMRQYTPATVTSVDAFEADLAAAERRGMYLEVGQYRKGLAGAAVLVVADKDIERRLVLGCVLPAAEMMTAARVVRTKLLAAARAISAAATVEQ
ncbi:MAG TPA: helix-turn-helix domain-containing protein [Micromonosporaceae bacterium]|nr:helix-turn-helix domain-containing protein [Micromonosporaceae bacterium]